MSALVIIGTRAMGREACTYAQEAGFTVKGFLDSKTDALSGFLGYPPVLASVEDYEVEPEDVFVCALGDPEYKQRYADVIAAKGGRFVSVVHPTAYVGHNVKIGDGFVCPRSRTAFVERICWIIEHPEVYAKIAPINRENRRPWTMASKAVMYRDAFEKMFD